MTNLVSAGLAVPISIILARVLGAEGFGTYAVIIALGAFGATIGALGQSTVVIAAVGRTPKEAHKSIIGKTFLNVGASSALIGFLLSLVAERLDPSLGGFAATRFLALPGLVLALAVSQHVSEAFRALNLIGRASFTGLPMQRLLLVGSLAFIAVGSIDLTAHAAITLTLACAASAALTGCLLLKRALDQSGTDHADPYPGRMELARAGVPIAIANAAAAGFQRLPIWALGATGSLTGAGTYAFASSIVSLLQLVQHSINGALAPRVAREFAQGEVAALEGTLRRTAAAGLVASLVLALILVPAGVVAGSWALGAARIDLVAVLVILALGGLFVTGTGSCGLLLNLSGFQHRTMVLSTATLLLAIPAVFIGASLGHAWGAAVAETSCIAVNNVGLMLSARQLTGIRTYPQWPHLNRSRG